MNRYSPHINPNHECVEMSIDDEGGWIHISEVKRLLTDIQRLRGAVARQEVLVDHFEPRARAACERPQKDCDCDGCAYRKEWKGAACSI